LRNAKPTCIKHPPICFITQAAELLEKPAAVIIKSGASKSGNVFQLDDCRLGFCNQAKCFREQIAFVVMPELLSGDREWRAGDPARKKIDSAKL
jgi:hypothetical protein